MRTTLKFLLASPKIIILGVLLVIFFTLEGFLLIIYYIVESPLAFMLRGLENIIKEITKRIE